MSILPANATARAPWLALLLATAALVAWPVDARGAAASGRDRPVSPPVLTDDALDSRWSALLRREPGSDAEAAAFAELEVAALELGYVELPTHALLLVQLADEAIRTGDPVAARRYLDWAARIAPRSAQPHFLDARIAWSASKADVGGVGARLERAYRVLGQSLAGDVAVRMQGRRVLGATGAGLALLFCVAMLVRHGSRVSHDLRLLSARTVSLTQASAAVVLLSLAPAVITGSPLAFVATAIALTAAYLTVRERVVALCVLAACAAAPRFAADYAGLVSAVEPGAARAVSAVLSPCDARCVALLREAHEREGDGVAGLAIAWTQFRRGTPDQRRRAVELLDGLELEGAARASALGLRGSLAFVDGDLDAAEQSFRAAYDLCTTRGQRGAVLFDLYRVHRALGHTEAAETALQGALSEAPHQLEALRDYRGRSQNGVLAAVPIPADYVADRIRAGTSPERVELAATQLLSTWYGVCPRALRRCCCSGRCSSSRLAGRSSARGGCPFAASSAPLRSVDSSWPRRTRTAAACSATSSTSADGS